MPERTSNKKPQQPELVLTRIFDAPRELVFKAWIDPKQLAQWFGPKDFTNTVYELDPRPSGKLLITMRGPDGTLYPTKGIFHEVVPPERIILTTSAFEDQNGLPQLRVLNTVTFVEHNGRTKITLRALVTWSTPAVADALAGMEQGWSQSFDKLAKELTGVKREKV
jgi:uncharacterized protein YndB with AHSA1/START domain